ncbi:MAG TPA: ABC transporter permease [Vicinamibacterales bacterium]|nr:ABC transporter permease [Vicinamibacterales bacterium]
MTARPSRVDRLLFRILVRLYPPPFRARYGRDLADAFERDRVRPRFAGFLGAIRFWRLTIADALHTAWCERRDGAGAAAPFALTPAGTLADLRSAARGLVRQPGFALAAILTLGLGIGATTTVFAIIDAVLLTPLPYPDAHRLVRVYERERANPAALMVAYGNYEDLRDQSEVFDELAIWAYASHALTGVSPARQLRTRETSENFAAALGVRPAHGRWFDRADIDSGARRVVLSHGLWQAVFGGRPGVVGMTVRLGDEPYEVVGVMPPGFEFPSRADAWIPLEPVTDEVGRRTRHRHNMIGRLRPGVTVAAAVRRLDALAARLEAAYPDFNRGNFFEPRLLLDDVIAGRDRALALFGVGVMVLLLIGCVNIASMALARSVGRVRELAVRAAIGASPLRLASLVASELTIVAAAGAGVGLLIAHMSVQAVLGLGGSLVPRAGEVPAISPRVLVFATLLSLGCGLGVSLLPILANRRLAADGSTAALRGTAASASPAVVRGRRILVAAQLTLAFVLATGAGLLLRSYDRLVSVDTGVVADRVLTMNIQVPDARYPRPDQVARFIDGVLDRIEALPGIERAGATLTPPVNDNGWYNLLTVSGRPVARPDLPPISYVVASAGYLDAIGVPLLAGRLYERGEPRGEAVAVLNEAAAARHFPGEDPIGRRILGSDNGDLPWARVIGVVGNIRQSLTRDAVPEVFVPIAQDRVLSFVIVVRTSGEDPLQAAPSVRAVIEQADRDVPVGRIMTLVERIGENVTRPKFTAAIMTATAALALLLAAAGVFGVVSYSVAARRREFGIRMAMGATGSRVVRQVMGEGLALAGVAIAIGIAAARAGAGWIESLLFDVRAADPVVYAGVGLVVLAVSVAAGLAPAFRATACDPLIVLREE